MIVVAADAFSLLAPSWLQVHVRANTSSLLSRKPVIAAASSLRLVRSRTAAAQAAALGQDQRRGGDQGQNGGEQPHGSGAARQLDAARLGGGHAAESLAAARGPGRQRNALSL